MDVVVDVVVDVIDDCGSPVEIIVSPSDVPVIDMSPPSDVVGISPPVEEGRHANISFTGGEEKEDRQGETRG